MKRYQTEEVMLAVMVVLLAVAGWEAGSWG